MSDLDLEAIKDASEYIGTIDSLYGQMCQMKDGKPKLILFELACAACSEVASKNADEWGTQFEIVVNAVPDLLLALDHAETARKAAIERGAADHAVAAAARALAAGPDSTGWERLYAALAVADKAGGE